MAVHRLTAAKARNYWVGIGFAHRVREINIGSSLPCGACGDRGSLKRILTGVAHSFYRFYLFSLSSFRKQDIAHTPGSIGDSLIILISTVICYYYCLCISINSFP